MQFKQKEETVSLYSHRSNSFLSKINILHTKSFFLHELSLRKPFYRLWSLDVAEMTKFNLFPSKQKEKNSCHCCCTAPVLSYPNSTYYKLESFSYTFNSHGEDYHSVNHFFSVLKLQGDIRITLFNLLKWFSICLNFQILTILNLTPILIVATPKTENWK